jgi:hypothetical protein
MDTKTAAAVDEKEVLWRVNYEEFIRSLRHQVCVAFVRSRVDSVAGTVLEGMLDATRRLETSAKQHSSGTQLQISQVSLIRCRRNQHILFAHIHQCLHGVVCIVREGL